MRLLENHFKRKQKRKELRRSKGNLKKAPQRKKEAAAANKEGGDYFAVEVLEAHQQDPWPWHVGTGNHGEGASMVGQAKY